MVTVNIEESVKEILANVKENGDAALIEYSKKFDGISYLNKTNLVLDVSTFKSSLDAISPDLLESLRRAKENIVDYNKAEFENILAHPLKYQRDNYEVKEKITIIERVGVYVPGGKFAYPSSVLMTVLPAKAAGVKDIIVATPMKNLTDVVKAALYLSGADKVLCVGGAQAVAAFAYGTELVDTVDIIVGPGNAYVTEAKRQVYGTVGIDMLAGPSDVTIWADDTIDVDWIVSDLHAQTEHDSMSKATFVSSDTDFIEKVKEKILPEFKTQVLFIKKRNLLECAHFINENAPEHLEILSSDKERCKEFLSHIKNAGAIFKGKYATVAMGDYYLGPSHTLPTDYSAAFSSGLSVHTFIKRTSIMLVEEDFVRKEMDYIANIADSEGLDFHAESIRIRKKYLK